MTLNGEILLDKQGEGSLVSRILECGRESDRQMLQEGNNEWSESATPLFWEMGEGGPSEAGGMVASGN